jgi:thiamine biosynthesis protein ThiS
MTGTAQQSRSKGPQPATERLAAVTVNGARRDVSGSIADLLAELSLDARSVVIEHNGIILRDRASLPDVSLADGDVVEIVHFVGGG